MQTILGSDLIKDSRDVLNSNFAELDSLYTVTFSGSPVFNLALGRTQKITLVASVASSTLTNQVAGVTYTFLIIQDATGGWTFSWPTEVRGAVEVGTEPSMGSIQEFISDGANLWPKNMGIINV